MMKRLAMNIIQRTALVVAVAALAALFLIPQVQPKCLAWWPVYTANTANAATTLAGILAPIISLATLAVVYFTFQIQGEANLIQLNLLQAQQTAFERQQNEFQATMARHANESFFSLTFTIVEQFSGAVERQQRLFMDVPEISLGIRRGQQVTSAESMGGTKPARQDELNSHQRQFFVLTQFFKVISRRFEGEGLTGEQKLVLLDLLDVGYGARVKTAIIEYQQRIGIQSLEQWPDGMYSQFEEQNILLFQLRKAAELQAGIERIPTGDPEPLQG